MEYWILRLLISLVVILLVNSEPSDVNRKNVKSNISEPFPVCHYDDPNIEACVLRAAELARTLLRHGSPQLRVPSLEPLRVPSVRLRQHGSAKQPGGHGFKYDAWLSDVTLQGLTDYAFKDLELNPDSLTLKGNITFPTLSMDADYIILGHFQMLPVEATGHLSANFTMCSAMVHAEAAKLRTRLVVRDSGVKLNCSGPLEAKLRDTYMEEDNDTRGMITNHIVQMHSKEIVSEIRPSVETALAMILEDIANKFLKGVPQEQILPKK